MANEYKDESGFEFCGKCKQYHNPACFGKDPNRTVSDIKIEGSTMEEVESELCVHNSFCKCYKGVGTDWTAILPKKN